MEENKDNRWKEELGMNGELMFVKMPIKCQNKKQKQSNNVSLLYQNPEKKKKRLWTNQRGRVEKKKQPTSGV